MQPGEVRTPVGIAGYKLASSTAVLAGSSCSSCAIEGNRAVKSCPLRLNTTTREPALCTCRGSRELRLVQPAVAGGHAVGPYRTTGLHQAERGHRLRM